MLMVFAQGHTVGNGQARVESSSVSSKPMILKFPLLQKIYTFRLVCMGEKKQHSYRSVRCDTLLGIMLLVLILSYLTLSQNQYIFFKRVSCIKDLSIRNVKDWKTVSFQKLHFFLQRRKNSKYKSICMFASKTLILLRNE